MSSNKNRLLNQKENVISSKITIYNKLPVIETALYYIGWILGMLYILYNVYLASQDNQHENKRLVDGWSFLGIKRDSSNFLYEILQTVFVYLIIYGIVHYLIAEILKCYCKKVLPYYYFLFSLSVIIFTSSYKTGMILIIQALISFTMAYFGNKFFIWFYGLTAIITMYFPQENMGTWCNLKYSQVPIFISIMLWNNLRYLSFALDIYTKKQREKITYNDYINYLGYCFYFPTLCHGPLLLYDDFQNVYTYQNVEKFRVRFQKFILAIIKYTIYFYLVIFSLHFLHYGLLFQLPKIHISYSGAHGLFWWAGYLFMTKHMIIYGLATSAAKAEGIKAPNPPQCIARIALYSEMWQNFDQSMYWFKRKYIFLSYINNRKSRLNQIVASLLCFAFIIVWHGAHPNVLIWAILNYVQLMLEKIGQSLFNTELYRKLYRNFLNPSNARRLAAVLSAPLLSISCISQYIFLGQQSYVGLYFVKRIMLESYLTNTFILLIVYCGCQVSFETKMRERQIKRKLH